MYLSEHELQDIIRCAESETGQHIEATYTEHGVELVVREDEELKDDYDNSLILGWRWV